jgi:hypothetical protein
VRATTITTAVVEQLKLLPLRTASKAA